MAWQTHLAGVLTAGGAPIPVFDANEAQQLENKDELPARYLLLYLSRRDADTLTMAGPALNRAWRLQTRCVGTSRYEASTLRLRLEEAIYRRVAPLNGSGLLDRDGDTDPAERDGSRWTAFDSWTYFTTR